MVVLKVVGGVRRHFLYRLPEWALSANLAGFALILLDPDHTFASSHTYDVMARIADEHTWGWVLLLAVAVPRLIALFLNGTFTVFARWSPLVRSVGAAMGAVVWGVIAVSFYAGNPATTGWWNYAVWMTVDAVLAVHIAGEAGRSWEAKRHAGA